MRAELMTECGVFLESRGQERHQRTCLLLDLTQHAEKSGLHSVAVQGMFSETEEERMSECQRERLRKLPRLTENWITLQ